MFKLLPPFQVPFAYNSQIGLSRVARFPLFFMSLTILSVSLGFNSSAKAKLRSFETTRLKSTGGAGVGSILMDEATSLNPASMGFYNISSLYVQKVGGQTQSGASSSPYEGQFEDMAVIASDASAGTAGSVSYVKQKRGPQERKIFAASLARPVSEKSSIGVTYRRGKQTTYPNNDSSLVTNSYNEFSIGASHAINENFSLGVLLDDPLQKNANSTLATVGFQYIFQEYVSLILDSGGDYTKNLASNFLYRGAMQVKFYNDFYLRFGAFRNEIKKESGSGAGLGWVGPRLVLEVGIKNTNVEDIPEMNQAGEDIRETSFSLAFKF